MSEDRLQAMIKKHNDEWAAVIDWDRSDEMRQKVRQFLQTQAEECGYSGWMYWHDNNGYYPGYDTEIQPLDPIDQDYYDRWVAIWESTADNGPREGDVVVDDAGTVFRLGHQWQTDTWQIAHMGFTLSRAGKLSSESGSLYEQVQTADLISTGETRDVSAWMPHHGHWKAGCGVWVNVPCRVYRWPHVSYYSRAKGGKDVS